MVPIGQAVSEETIFKHFPIGYYVKSISADVGSVGWQVGSSDKILKGEHPMTIPTKFGPNWPSSFRGEDFKDFFSHGEHLGWWKVLSDIILKGDYPRTIPAMFDHIIHVSDDPNLH